MPRSSDVSKVKPWPVASRPINAANNAAAALCAVA